jgi:hypothetical protein
MFDEVGKGGLVAGVGVGVLLLATPVVFLGVVGGWWLLREPALAPPTTYAFTVPAADRAAAGIDLLDLHRERWPAVIVARDPDARASAADAVRAAVRGDEGLVTVSGQVLDALADGDARTASDAAEVWNAALAARGMPFALQAGGTPPRAYVKSYWLAAVPTVRVGDRATTVRTGLRVDRLNVVEGWLGIAEDVGGAIVVVDRVRDFAVEDLWPRLDPDDAAPLSAAVRADVAARLAPELAAVLTRTAPAQRALRAAVDGVEGRRSRCGSTFVLRVPWDGVDDFANLRAWVDASADPSCPGITDDEVDALVAGTLAIRGEPALARALEALVALAARHVAVHEARHRLDHEDWGFATPPPCAACAGLSDRATIEASAYLAAFRSPESTIALVQSCEVLATGGGGSAAQALERILAATGAACDAAPPADLAARAGEVASAWFGDRGAVTVEGLPPSLPLTLREPGEAP